MPAAGTHFTVACFNLPAIDPCPGGIFVMFLVDPAGSFASTSSDKTPLYALRLQAMGNRMHMVCVAPGGGIALESPMEHLRWELDSNLTRQPLAKKIATKLKTQKTRQSRTTLAQKDLQFDRFFFGC